RYTITSDVDVLFPPEAAHRRHRHSFPTRRSSDLSGDAISGKLGLTATEVFRGVGDLREKGYRIDAIPARGYRLVEVPDRVTALRSEEHTSELQSRENLVCRLLLEKNK